MGMLDEFFGGNMMNDPDVMSKLGLITSLLSTKKGENAGAPIMNYTLMQQKNKADERANRTNELQQVAGTYKVLKDLDNQAMLQASMEGRQHTPNPQLAAIEARLGELTGQSPMTRATPQPPQFPPQPPGIPASIASQSSLAVRPELRQPMPPQSGPQGLPQLPQQGQQSQQNLGQLADMAGVPKPVAMGLISAGKPEELMKLIAEGFKVRGSGGNFMKLNPQTGQMDFVGGQVSPSSFPVTAVPGGGLKVQPVQGLNDAIAAQAKAKVSAEKSTESQYEIVPLKMPDGRTLNVTKAQLLQMTGGQPQASSESAPERQVAPDVQGGRDQSRMKILLAERDFLSQQGKTDPALEKEIQLQQGGKGFGYTSGQSTAQESAAQTNPKLQLELLTKSFEDNSKANDSLQFLNASRQAIKQGTFTGALSKPTLLVARFGSAFGIGPQDKVANSEEFLAMAGRQVMGSIKSLGSGSGISDSDREYAAKAMGGSLQLNEQTITRLLDIQEKTTKRGIEMHNSRVDQAEKAGVPSVYDYRIKPYEPTQSQGSSDTKQVMVGQRSVDARRAPNGKYYVKSGSKYYEVQE